MYKTYVQDIFSSKYLSWGRGITVSFLISQIVFFLFFLYLFCHNSLLYLPHLVDHDLIVFAYFATRLWSHLPSLSQSAISSTASSAPHLMFWGPSRWTDCHPSAGVGGGGAGALWAAKSHLWERHGPAWPPVNSGELSRLRLGSIITTACHGESKQYAGHVIM